MIIHIQDSLLYHGCFPLSKLDLVWNFRNILPITLITEKLMSKCSRAPCMFSKKVTVSDITADLCFNKTAIPYDEFEGNPQTLLITTSRGGHFGFLEGIWPTKETWMNRVNRELLAALKNYEKSP